MGILGRSKEKMIEAVKEYKTLKEIIMDSVPYIVPVFIIDSKKLVWDGYYMSDEAIEDMDKYLCLN